jgi:cytochrome c-type biogenesis protein CcmH/NrfG
VTEGARLARGGDFGGALATLREAIRLEPGTCLAFLMMGTTYVLQGDFDQALDNYRTAARIAEEFHDDHVQARALHGIAATLELMEGRLAEARDAWTRMAQFADAHRAVANPEIARARIQAINAALDRRDAYVAVRQRIAAREAENARDARRQRNAD